MEYLYSLPPEIIKQEPLADGIRAWLYTVSYRLDETEELLRSLELRFSQSRTQEARAAMGEMYITFGLVSMMRAKSDLVDYFKKAAERLPGGSIYSLPNSLKVFNTYSFFMQDNSPGAEVRIEKAIHYGIPWFIKAMNGSMSRRYAKDSQILTECYQ